MHTGIPVGYGQQTYQSHGGSGFYGQSQPQTANSYGNVSYAAHGGDLNSQASMEHVKQGLQTIRDLFPSFQSGHFDPRSYQQVEERLAAIQQFQLPFLSGPIPQAQAIDVGGGSQAGAIASIPQYTLPPMDNLRTKEELMNLDQVVAAMQSTIYDNPNNLAAAGIAQPGAHYVGTGMGYRSSHSPPNVHLTPTHQHAVSTPPSYHEGTPALTPPSSAVSMTSGNSPPSMHPHGLSPPSPVAMYPTLPGPSSDNLSGYLPSGMAPSATLGNQFDNEHRRRFSGGRLQRAAPSSIPKADDGMDTSEDGATTPKARAGAMSPKEGNPQETSTQKGRNGPFSRSRLDPALGGGSASSPESATGEMDEKSARAEEMWVGNIRTIEAIRAWIKQRLEREEYDTADAKKVGSESPKKKEGESLYPTLVKMEE